MTRKRINFTKRKKLQSKLVTVRIPEENGAKSFEVKLELEENGYPDSARIILEAYRHSQYQRYELGTLATPKIPEFCTLDNFDSVEGVRFRLKLVSGPADPKRQGQILAQLDKIRPERPDADAENSGQSLLVVKPDDTLGDEVWRLDLDSGDPPILCINSNAGEWRSVVKSEVFVTLVYPAVVRMVLEHILLRERYAYPEEGEDADDIDWPEDWLQFAANLPGMQRPPGQDSEESDRMNWIMDATAAFCRNHQCLKTFQEYWK